MPLLALLLGLLGLGLLFSEEIRAAIGVWIDSTAYGHCFFVIPIALFLAWERRQSVHVTPVVPMPVLALLAVPMALVWLFAERMGIMEGQQILLMGFVELLFVTVLGWRMAWVLAVPLLYLGFLVPFGAFVTPWLQDFTASFIVTGLGLLGIPYIADGMTIEIPEGAFFVAEACAGLRFLIASIAFGVLYACMIYRSPRRRLAFIAASVVIPIVANGFRGLGIVALGHIIGNAEAAAVDHVVYGWLFFSFVILLLILAGLPFREDSGPMPVPVWRDAPASTSHGLFVAVAAVLAVAAVAPLFAGWLDRRAATEALVDAPASLGAIAGCSGVEPQRLVRGSVVTWSYSCAMGRPEGKPLALSVSLLPARANPGAIGRLRRQATGEAVAEDVSSKALRHGSDAVWRLVTTTGPDRLTAIGEWIDARPAPGGLAQRRLQAWNSLFGSEHGQVLASIGTPATGKPLSRASQRQAEAAIGAVIDLNPDLADRLGSVAKR